MSRMARRANRSAQRREVAFSKMVAPDFLHSTEGRFTADTSDHSIRGVGVLELAVVHVAGFAVAQRNAKDVDAPWGSRSHGHAYRQSFSRVVDHASRGASTHVADDPRLTEEAGSQDGHVDG